jgi:hypothetical protein
MPSPCSLISPESKPRHKKILEIKRGDPVPANSTLIKFDYRIKTYINSGIEIFDLYEVIEEK